MSLNGCGDIFDEKVLQITERRADEMTDGRNDGQM